MQRHSPLRFAALGLVAVAAAFGLFLGCAPTPVAAPNGAAKPFAGMKLKIAVADPALGVEISGRAKAWANRHAATITMVTDRPPREVGDADISVVPLDGISGPASRGELAAVPESLSGTGKPFRWDTLFIPYQSSLVQWGSAVVAVPITGDGLVCVYRADRFRDPDAKTIFRDRFQKDLAPPRTWEDIAEIASAFQRPDRPSLPPISKDRADALALFHQMAACYDRAPTASGNKEEGGAARALSFHIDIVGDRFQPRSNAPTFAAAYDWFHKTAAFRPSAPGDPLAAIDTGTAVVAVLTLRELARLPRDPKTGAVSDAFGIAPVPGTRTYFDAGGRVQQAAGGRNAVPFLGGNATFATVSKSSENASAAWDFLSDLVGPEGSIGMLHESQLGAGPTREGHIAPQAGIVNWQRYGFDEARTKDLAAALNIYADSTVANPALPLRTPDAPAIYAILDAQLRRAAAGQATGSVAAAAATAAWAEHDKASDAAVLKDWRRKAAGLD